jgi:hypothetical protein
MQGRVPEDKPFKNLLFLTPQPLQDIQQLTDNQLVGCSEWPFAIQTKHLMDI